MWKNLGSTEFRGNFFVSFWKFLQRISQDFEKLKLNRIFRTFLHYIPRDIFFARFDRWNTLIFRPKFPLASKYRVDSWNKGSYLYCWQIESQFWNRWQAHQTGSCFTHGIFEHVISERDSFQFVQVCELCICQYSLRIVRSIGTEKNLFTLLTVVILRIETCF